MLRRLLLALSALGLAASLGGTAPVTPQRHLSDLDAVLSAPSAYSFSTVLTGSPVRWDPCTPIHWRYRTSGQITGGFQQVVRAIQRIASVTGTRWVYDGSTTAAPTTAWLPKHADERPPVLIGWATPRSSDLLRGQSPTVLGVTRTAWFSVTQGGRTTSAIRGAVVALNQAQRLPLTGSVSWYTTVLHELSHATGLGHATSTKQLLYPVLQRGLTDLQPGDVTGLRRLGRSAGCIHL